MGYGLDIQLHKSLLVTILKSVTEKPSQIRGYLVVFVLLSPYNRLLVFDLWNQAISYSLRKNKSFYLLGNVVYVDSSF